MYFTKNGNDEVAVCNKCKAFIKCKGWLTSGLIRHLKNKHDIQKSVVPAKRREHIAAAGLSASLGYTEQPHSVFYSLNYRICFFVSLI